MRDPGRETRTYRIDWEATIEGAAYIEASSVTEAVRWFNKEPGIYTNPLVSHKVVSKPAAMDGYEYNGYRIKAVGEEYDENGNRIKCKEEE